MFNSGILYFQSSEADFDMELPELVAEFERLCNAAPGSLDKSAVIDLIPGWNSLAFLGLIASIDDLYNVTLKPRQITQCSTIADLYSLLQIARGNSKTNFPRP